MTSPKACRLLLLFAALSLTACAYDAPSVGPGGNPGTGPGAPPGGPGVTAGGVQDINYARSLIEAGQVPQADAITVEGLLSQHDLPTVGAPCDNAMCLRPAMAVAPSLETGELEFWLHLGFASGLDDWVRPAMDLTIVIDRSGSMVGDMAETNEAAIDMLRQLTPDDRVSILAFNESVEVVHAHAPVGDLEALSARVRQIDAHGSWDIDTPLHQAVDMQRRAGDSPDRIRRVVVLSCAYPNADEGAPFAQLVREASRERIGFTFVGILLSWSPQLGDLLGATRGGNYFYTETLESIEAVFDNEFDFMMAPLAYDLSIDLSLSDAYTVDRAFGIPADPEGATGAHIDVSTAFLSSRRGGIVVRLAAKEAFDPELGYASLSYSPESAQGFAAAHQQTGALSLPIDDAEVHWGSDGVRKAVALANFGDEMRQACDDWHSGRRDEAITSMERVVEYLSSEAEALDDDGLRDEHQLATRLLAAMR